MIENLGCGNAIFDLYLILIHNLYINLNGKIIYLTVIGKIYV